MDRAVVVSATVSFLCYMNTLNHGFVYDDNRAILANSDIHVSAPLSHLLLHDFWGTPLWHGGSHGSYRPLTTLTFRLNTLLSRGELNPQGFHLTNVILHSLTTAAFTRFTRIITLKNAGIIPWISGIMFAIHPVHTEAVAGIVGRADVLAGLFFVLSLLIYDAHLKRGGRNPTDNPIFFCSSVFLALCSTLCKENGIMALLVIPLYEVIFYEKQDPGKYVVKIFQNIFDAGSSFKTTSKSRCSNIFTMLFCFVVVAAVRIGITRGQIPKFSAADNPVAHDESLLTRMLTFLYLPVFNIFLLLCPSTLSFDWSMNSIPLIKNVLDFRNFITILVYFALTVIAYRHLRLLQDSDSRFDVNANNTYGVSDCSQNLSKKSKYIDLNGYLCTSSRCSGRNQNSESQVESAKIVLIGLALIILPFLPATNLLMYVGFVVAERIMYIPSMGYCIIMGHSVNYFMVWSKKYRSKKLTCLVKVSTMLFLVLLMGRTFRRNLDWRDEESLYRSGIDTNPPKAYGNLGNILSLQGRLSEAEECYKKALSYRPNMADVHYNFGILLQNLERYEEAIFRYKTAIRCRPKLTVAYLNLGIVLVQVNRMTEAENVFKSCLTIDGSGTKDPKTHEAARTACMYQLGRMHMDNDKLAEAIYVLQEAVRYMPSHYPPQSIYNMLGEAYSRLGRDVDAEPWFQAALASRPDHIPAHLTYGKLLARNGSRILEAEVWYKRAERLAPLDAAVFRHYGQFLLSQNRFLEAAMKFERAMELATPEYEDIVRMATSFRLAGKFSDAEMYYKLAIEMKPMEASSIANLGALYHLIGRLEDAEHYYKRALVLLPEDEVTKENLTRLRRLKKTNKEKEHVAKRIMANH